MQPRANFLERISSPATRKRNNIITATKIRLKATMQPPGTLGITLGGTIFKRNEEETEQARDAKPFYLYQWLENSYIEMGFLRTNSINCSNAFLISFLEGLVAKAETKTQLKKLLNAVKSDRRNSTTEKYEADGAQETEGENKGITSPVNLLRKQSLGIKASPTLSDRRPSRSLLHPDHAKLMVQRRSSLLTPPLERYALSFEDSSRAIQNGGFITSPLSSSAASSVTSISNGPALGSNVSDPLNNYESRRSSTMTNKYSLLDALDLEYALIKAAARGSIGPYSLSQSLQKLTFTQSLAFPALARGISNKKNSSQSNTKGPLDPLDSGVNAFAKVATVLVLVLISVLVFGVLYKFIRT